MSAEPFCRAIAYRKLYVEGFLGRRCYESAKVICGQPRGHDGKHSGWLTMFVPGETTTEALVKW